MLWLVELEVLVVAVVLVAVPVVVERRIRDTAEVPALVARMVSLVAAVVLAQLGGTAAQAVVVTEVPVSPRPSPDRP
jgi:hypothetical protein